MNDTNQPGLPIAHDRNNGSLYVAEGDFLNRYQGVQQQWLASTTGLSAVEVAWHYTNHGETILQTETIRAYDLRTMEDRLELQHGCFILRDTLSRDFSHDPRAALLGERLDELTSFALLGESPFRMFALCAAGDSDSALDWGTGKPGGMALGIRADAPLSILVGKHPTHGLLAVTSYWRRVLYDVLSQRNLSYVVIEQMLDARDDTHVMGLFSLYSAFVKDPRFRHEAEVRYAVLILDNPAAPEILRFDAVSGRDYVALGRTAAGSSVSDKAPNQLTCSWHPATLVGSVRVL